MTNKSIIQEDLDKVEESIVDIEQVVNMNKDYETKSKDNLSETVTNNDSLPNKEDTIIDIEVKEDNLSSLNNLKKNHVWVYSQYFTKRLWHKGHHRIGQEGRGYTDVWTQSGGGGQYYSGDPYEGEPLIYDPETRNSFVRLVMIITLVMLLLTAGFVAYVFNTPPARKFFRRNGMTILIISLILYLIPSYGMVLVRALRKPPCSIFMLLLTLVSMSCIAAIVTCLYRTDIILMAIGATAGIVFVCVVLACTSFDFTKFYLYVVVIGLAFSLVGVMVLGYKLITGESMTTIRLVMLIAGVLLQAVMLVMELQMILGGRAIELEEDDYSLGAFMLYTSIVDLFLKMVQILGLTNS